MMDYRRTSIAAAALALFVTLGWSCVVYAQGGGPAIFLPLIKANSSAQPAGDVSVVSTPVSPVPTYTPTTAPTAISTESPTAQPTTAPTVTETPTSDGAAECPTGNFVSVSADPNNAAYADPVLNVYCSGDTMVVESNGIPSFEFVRITPSDLAEQDYAWEIPLNPVLADTPSDIPFLGPVAIAVDGLPIYGPNEGGPTYGDPYLDGILDFCNGHTAQRGDYHYHALPDCLFDSLANGTANAAENVDLVIGYAFDGFPIMAPFVCDNADCSQVREVQSSWQRVNDVAAAWDAHEYVAGSGDLDQCNGMVGADGTYRYYATATFPYLVGCYSGVASNTNGGGQPGGPGPGAQAAGGVPTDDLPADGATLPDGPPPFIGAPDTEDGQQLPPRGGFPGGRPTQG